MPLKRELGASDVGRGSRSSRGACASRCSGGSPNKMHGGFVSRIYHAKRWEHPSINTGVVYPWRIRMYAIWMDPHLPWTKNPVMLASIYHTIGIRWIRRMDPSWANGVIGTSSFTHAELIGKSSSEMWRLPDDIWCGDSWNLVGPSPKEFSMVLEYLPTFAPKISHVGKSWQIYTSTMVRRWIDIPLPHR